MAFPKRQRTEMENAHQRTKQPHIVRRALLNEAARIAVEHGLHAVTVQAVADAAGVTKGGLMHHFASKRALLDALFQDLAEAYERDIAARVACQPSSYGVFTRAYIDTAFDDLVEEAYMPRAILCILAISDARMREYWSTCMQKMCRQYAETDSDLSLAMARFTVDGYWLAHLVGSDIYNPAEIRDSLLRQTYRVAE